MISKGIIPGPGDGSITYSVTDNKTWMSGEKECPGGTDAGQTCGGKVSFNTSGLAPGAYTGTVTVTGGLLSKNIPVSLNINQKPSVSYGEGSFTSCSAYEASFTVNPNSECGATYKYQFGTDPSNLTDAGTGTITVADSVTLKKTFTGLTPGTVYYYRIVATNGSGTTTGETQQISSFPVECSACKDNDGDSFKGYDAQSCQTGTDCDDTNSAINPNTIWYKDSDGDLYSDGTAKTQCERASGYKLPSELTATSGDCDDSDTSKTPVDKDGDGYSTCAGDCNDVDVAKSPTDNDGDGYSTCTGDCDDNNSKLTPADGDADGYSSCTEDCDDTNPLINPGGQEQTSIFDFNCNGSTAETSYGESSSNMCVASTANPGSGNLYHSQQIYKNDFVLAYNSLDNYAGPLGRGWTHNFNIKITEGPSSSLEFHRESGKRIFFRESGGIYYPEARSDEYSSIVKNQDGTYTRVTKAGVVYLFDTAGRLTSITDRNNNITALEYSGGNLASIIDSVGRKSELAYDNEGHIIQFKSPDGQVTAFTYDSNGNLAFVTGPTGSAWTYTYDTSNRMSTKTDPAGNMVTYAYDAYGRLTSSSDGAGKTKTIVYDHENNTASITEYSGGLWTYKYDSLLDVRLEAIDPQGNITKYAYDSNRNLVSTTLSDGSMTSYTYDVYGNRTSVTDALGQTTTYAYDTYGQVLSVTDPQGNSTNYSYDSNGNLTAVADPAGATTQYQYDSKGNIVKIINAAGQATIMAYDAYNNLKSLTDPNGATSQFTYDINGNLTSQTAPNGAVTKFEYNALNQLVKVTDPNGQISTYTYDALGNRTSETDANGNKTTYEYNYKGQLTKVNDTLGNITEYSYGGSGCSSCGGGVDKLTSITDTKGNTTSYKYDKLGRLLEETDPLGNAIAYSYDSRGNLISKTDANGNTITYAYDALGRLTEKKYPDGTTEAFNYDSKGKTTYAGNKDIAYSFAYDANGRTTGLKDSNGLTISYKYDSLGNRTEMTTPEGKVINYSYDQSNRLARITPSPLAGEGWGEGEFAFSYDPLGRRTALSYPNGARGEYTYDNIGRLTNLTHKTSSGSTIDSFSYTHVRGSGILISSVPFVGSVGSFEDGAMSGVSFDTIKKERKGPLPLMKLHVNTSEVLQICPWQLLRNKVILMMNRMKLVQQRPCLMHKNLRLKMKLN